MTTFTSFQQNSVKPADNAPQPGFLSKVGGFLSGAAKSVLNPIVTSGVDLGRAAGYGVSKLLGAPQQGIDNAMSQDTTVPLPFGQSITVPAQKAFGQGGGEQIAGKALSSAAEIVPGGAEGIGSKGIVGGITQGLKVGALSGALGGAGQSMQQGGNAGDVFTSGATGALTGAAVGGAVGGASGLAGNIWDKAYGEGTSGYQANVDSAGAANTQAGTNAVGSIHEASNVLGDVKSGLSQQFTEAPNIIAKADPNAGTTVTTDFMSKLNDLKESKTFQLPESLKNIIPDIKSGTYKLSPQQTQDLITQLNELTYKAKASGDLAINQQSIGLTNELKNAAQTGMGHVTDAQGNSVWNRAYQDFRQGSDALDSMSSLIPTKNSVNEILDPTQVNASVDKMMKMMETPQGTASLMRANAEFKSATGFDVLTDPMGAINKLAQSNKDFAAALKGGYMHQFIQGFKNPRLLNRRALGVVGTILGITALGTTFRKQVGNFFSGQ